MNNEEDLMQFLQRRLAVPTKDIGTPASPCEFKPISRHIVCANGGRLSVQASKNHYSTPRDDYGPYTHAEVGAIRGLSCVADLFKEYHDGDKFEADDADWSVFGYVPLGVIAMLILMNGGLDDAEASKDATMPAA